MSDLVASLDNALAEDGEDFILRRVVGAGASAINVDVTCRGRIDGVSTAEIQAGIKATDVNVIFSPTQINDAQWPGGTVPQLPPFNVDQRVPRENGSDQAIIQGRLYIVGRAKPFFIGDELVRIEMRASALT